jgi:hypothetical protein
MMPLGGKFFRTAGESSYHVKPRPQRNESKLTRILFFSKSNCTRGCIIYLFRAFYIAALPRTFRWVEGQVIEGSPADWPNKGRK